MPLAQHLPNDPARLERALRGIRLTQAECDRVTAHIERLKPPIRRSQYLHLLGMIVRTTPS